MAIKYGKTGKMMVGTSEVIQIRNWKLQLTIDEYESSALGDGWAKPVPIFSHWQATCEAIYDPGDTNGQLALQNAALSGSKVQPKFYIDGTNYWAPDTSADTNAGGYIQNFSVNQARAAVGIADLTIKGYGPIKMT
jgi:hypothetical protein